MSRWLGDDPVQWRRGRNVVLAGVGAGLLLVAWFAVTDGFELPLLVFLLLWYVVGPLSFLGLVVVALLRRSGRVVPWWVRIGMLAPFATAVVVAGAFGVVVAFDAART